MMKRLAHFIYEKKNIIIAAVVLLNIIAILSFYNFRFSTDYLSFFKGDHAMSATYDEISKKYQGIETIQILIETNHAGDHVTSKENLIKIASYINQLEAVEGTTFIQSFLPQQIPTPQGILHIDEGWIDTHYDQLLRVMKEAPFTKDLISQDNNLGLIIIGLDDFGDKDLVIENIQAIGIGNELSLDYAGNQIIIKTIFDYLWKIILTLPPLAILLVLTVFYFNIRVRKLTILAMLPAAFGALWTFGTVFLLGKELSIITVIAPIFIIVLGSADGLHFVIHYLDHLKTKKKKLDAIEETLKMVGSPIIMTTLTTMAGFLSLSFSDVTSMRDLGITTALGIAYAGIISIFFLPAILSKMEIDLTKIKENHENRFITLLKKLVRHRVAILSSFFVIVLFLGSFIPTLVVDSNQLGFFKKGSEIRKTFDKIEAHFGSSLPIIGEYKKPQDGLFDSNYANHILSFERGLEKKEGIKKIVSAYDLILGGSKQLTGQEQYPSREILSNLLIHLEDTSSMDMKQWVSDDGIKFMITTSNITGEEQDQLIEELKSNPNISSLTGLPILFREMNKLIVSNQFSSLFIALGLVSIMLGLSFRNLKNTIVGLVPIVITVISLLGFLAITNMNLNMMTANMSSIAIGVGIDYSIHFIAVMSYYQRQKHEDFIEKTLDTVGKPILTNALGLAIGLSAYLLSPFRIHSQVSMVMWLAMLLSSLSALLIIPQFYRSKKSSKAN